MPVSLYIVSQHKSKPAEQEVGDSLPRSFNPREAKGTLFAYEFCFVQLQIIYVLKH